MPARFPTGWLRQIKRNAKEDPKKAGFLTILCVVLVFLVTRQMMKSGGSGPAKTASASSKTTKRGAQAPGNVVARPTISHGAAEAMRQWMLAPPKPLSRNLFAVKLDYFPRDGGRLAKPSRAMNENGFWDEVAKSMASDADHLRDRQILIDNLRTQAARLRLQTTIMGAEPKALINGELVGENSVVASFRVLKIEARRIIVEREGIKLEIQMK